MKSKSASQVLGITVLALNCMNAACSDPSPTETEEQLLKAATWWAVGSEQEALQRVVTSFRASNANTDVELVKVVNDPQTRKDLYHTIEWDIGQEGGTYLSTNIGDLALDLNTVPELAAANASVQPEFVSALTHDGKLLGFPTNVHRENTLHYMLALMPTPPTNLAELRAVCDDYVEKVNDGQTPPKPMATATAVAGNAWIHRELFGSMLPPDVMAGTAADPMPAITDALETIKHFADNGCLFYADSWDLAAHALVDGNAVMFIHGDWARGYLVQNGKHAGTDFQVAPTPGAEGGYYYNIDTFAVNEAGANRDLAIEFLLTALAPDVQISFSEVKGSTPAVKIADPDTQISDPALRATYKELEAARLAGSFITQTPWVTDHDVALLPVFQGGSVAEVAATLRAGYPQQP
jgi:ABC-type glycerol-3-phosphate transport system substrate-binding protein